MNKLLLNIALIFQVIICQSFIYSQSTLYKLTTLSNPALGGTLSGAGDYAAGTTVAVTATPADGYSVMLKLKKEFQII